MSLLQEIKIQSDSNEVLKEACKLFWACNKDLNLTYFFEKTDENQNANITMLSYSMDTKNGDQKLPFPIKNPEQLYFFLINWLESKQYIFPKDLGWFDGDVNPGWFISNEKCYNEDKFKFGRAFILYGK